MRPPIDSGTVLITGVSSGIGRELARQLARRARTLVLVARSGERLEALREELLALNPTLGVWVEQCDLSQPEHVDALLDSLRRNLIRVDVLVNNAGMGDYGLYEQESWPRIHQMVQANMTAPLLLTHRLVRRMVERKRGGILNIGSGGGSAFVPGLAVYAATQRFLDGFTEALRLELLGTGVVVTQVAPGPVDTGGDEAAQAPDCALASWLRIPAARCASEALAGFERAEPLVYPGWAHRWMMRLAVLLPRRMKRAVWLPAARRLRYGTAQLGPAHPDSALGLLLAGGPGNVRDEA
ncbi:SDR family NAD(P)-dependent oxidoreductase [Cystobacter fuscus]|uniref:SDR family NAD(P)-dependent oxidoreductase n=1 Tax=Cystobacter fuscus TaxID=43 RepID=UPI002B2B6C05|nr:SDR family oxidoreductase [Cystobacter fuscus]